MGQIITTQNLVAIKVVRHAGQQEYEIKAETFRYMAYNIIYIQRIVYTIPVLLCFVVFNSSPTGQNGRHFTDDIFRCTFVNEKFRILIKISLKCVLKGPIDNNPALV